MTAPFYNWSQIWMKNKHVWQETHTTTNSVTGLPDSQIQIQFKISSFFCMMQYNSNINSLPALTYQNVLDLNVAYRAERTKTYWHVRKFKCPLKKNADFLPMQ
jgi:hypothetical protein